MTDYICCNDNNGMKILDCLETIIEDFPEGLQSFELHFGLDDVLTIKNMHYHPKTKDKTKKQMDCKEKKTVPCIIDDSFNCRSNILGDSCFKTPGLCGCSEPAPEDKASEAIKELKRFSYEHQTTDMYTKGLMNTIEQELKDKDEGIQNLTEHIDCLMDSGTVQRRELKAKDKEIEELKDKNNTLNRIKHLVDCIASDNCNINTDNNNA